MSYLNMSKAMLFNEKNIFLIDSKTGNYALGIVKKDQSSYEETFFVNYVGRSDDDLNARLIKHYYDQDIPCTHFKYSYALTEKEAYSKECRNYHDFKNEYNDIHPRKPDGMGDIKCPVCGQ